MHKHPLVKSFSIFKASQSSSKYKTSNFKPTRAENHMKFLLFDTKRNYLWFLGNKINIKKWIQKRASKAERHSHALATVLSWHIVENIGMHYSNFKYPISSFELFEPLLTRHEICIEREKLIFDAREKNINFIESKDAVDSTEGSSYRIRYASSYRDERGMKINENVHFFLLLLLFGKYTSF